MKKKKANTLVFTIFFFILFLAFCAMAIDGTIILNQRMKLQNAAETAALAGASELNSNPNNLPDQIAAAEQAAKDTFALLKYGGLENVDVNNATFVSVVENYVDIDARMIAQPFFLAFLGVTGINLEANAHAVSAPLQVRADYSGHVSWVTANSVFLTDILANPNSPDTIKPPIIWGKENLASYFPATSGSTPIVNYGLIESSGTSPLSLGPGGYVTIKLPSPIIDKPGNDLYIQEAGDALEGYMVFAGIDADPANPYKPDGSGGEIYWKNISCSGISETAVYNALTTTSTDGLSNQEKFYGSGNFDLGATCLSGNISMAKYIRIIDDNAEDAFIRNTGGVYQKVNIYGEGSTSTAGADIDNIKVLNVVSLIKKQ